MKLYHIILLSESLNSAKERFVGSGKIVPEVFEKLSQIDITPTKKYLEKICDYYLQNSSLQNIEHYIHQFDILTSKNLIQNKDINSYKTFDQLKSTIDSLGKNIFTKHEQKQKIKEHDVKKIYEDETYLVVMPKSKMASVMYGKGTKWCISSVKSQNYWNQYVGENLVRFYFIFNKKLNENNPLYKVAVAIYPPEMQKKAEEIGRNDLKIEAYNAADKLINFQKYIATTTIPISIFKYKKITKSELNSATIDEKFIEVVKNGNLKAVILALKHGADIHADDDLALRWASYNGHFDIIKYLVECGADIHVRDDYALRWASQNGHFDIVKYLVECGANIHAKNDWALRLACLNGHFDIIKYLVECGADTHVYDDWAIRNAKTQKIKKYLVYHG